VAFLDGAAPRGLRCDDVAEIFQRTCEMREPHVIEILPRCGLHKSAQLRPIVVVPVRVRHRERDGGLGHEFVRQARHPVGDEQREAVLVHPVDEDGKLCGVAERFIAELFEIFRSVRRVLIAQHREAAEAIVEARIRAGDQLVREFARTWKFPMVHRVLDQRAQRREAVLRIFTQRFERLRRGRADG